MANPTASDDSAAPPRGRLYWLRTIGYWTCTAIIAWEMVAGSMWDLLRIEYTRGVFTHLGYPHYLLLIIGVWKLPCAVTILVPRFLRLKEWAYAGAVFNYTGAAASHLLVGDRASRWMGPLIFTAITLASWALRPQDRRVPRLAPATPVRIISWIIPLGLVVVFLVVALLTLPKGPPPL
ncbi:MAG TPA: DoxX family protein [Polyangia bacterium]|nr:DoxX family protein [Polyangia bacterium]